MGKSHALHASFVALEKSSRQGVHIVNVVHVLQGAAESQPTCNLTGEIKYHP